MDREKIFNRAFTIIMIAPVVILFVNHIYSDIYFLRNGENFIYESSISVSSLIFFFLIVFSSRKLREIFTGQPPKAQKNEEVERSWTDHLRTLIGIGILNFIGDKSKQLSQSGLNNTVNVDAVTMDIITLWVVGIAGFMLFHFLWGYFEKKNSRPSIE